MSSWRARLGLLLLFCSPASAGPITAAFRTQIQESIANLADTFGDLGDPAVEWEVLPVGDATVIASDFYSLSSSFFVRSGFEWYGSEGIDAGRLADGRDIYISIGISDTSSGRIDATRIDAVKLAFAPLGYASIGGDLAGMATDFSSGGWLNDPASEDTFEEYYRAFVPFEFGAASGLLLTGK